MFVKTTRIKRGNKCYEYLTLVEAVRDGDRTGHRVLFRLGEASALRASGELDRIIAALQAHAEGRWLPVDELAADRAPAVGGVAAVAAQWQRLGLDDWFAKLGADRGAALLAASAGIRSTAVPSTHTDVMPGAHTVTVTATSTGCDGAHEQRAVRSLR